MYKNFLSLSKRFHSSQRHLPSIFLSNKRGLLGNINIDMGNATNTTAHTSLKVKLYCNTSLEKRKQLRKPATQKILWGKGDINKYQQTVAQQIQTPTVLQQNVNDALTSITKILSDSTKHAIPTKTINLHGQLDMYALKYVLDDGGIHTKRKGKTPSCLNSGKTYASLAFPSVYGVDTSTDPKNTNLLWARST